MAYLIINNVPPGSSLTLLQMAHAYVGMTLMVLSDAATQQKRQLYLGVTV